LVLSLGLLVLCMRMLKLLDTQKTYE
jgi:hypothetical protein